MKRFTLLTLLLVSGAIATACQPPTTPSASNSPSASESPTAVSTHQETTRFDEELYLFANPDVKKLIQQGKYKSGQDHYSQIGQTAKKPNGEKYESFFTGTNGNDTVQGFGKGEHAHFSGVKIEIVPKKGDALPLRPQSLGRGEMDTLIGTKEGGNEFLLGSFITSVNPKAEPFYVGNGDQDYARIQNFNKSKDGVVLAGEPNQYKFESVDGNVRISTVGGDLVAIVEGVDKLEVGETAKDFGVFSLK
ncbi:hypothetical protein K9N68_33510 [Kovacikia minuta CCNUW1]|uniref:hypothetical protein n=1 Tax=Kovacikia minuta TaxID=2931930 RepID=UPI001CCF99EE|nr:hypothetical protein [Kovacikia minuta]UBF26363.1 hypothetical protein K9N68_33510 [Kovacikia minuta CCNUW1]